MSNGAQGIHLHLDGSMPVTCDSISTEQGGVPDSPGDLTKDCGQARYLRRICKAIELQAAIAKENHDRYPIQIEEEQEDPTDLIRVIRERYSQTKEIENFAIYSEPLVKIIQDVAVFYPGVNLHSNPLFITRPFSLLFHTLPALREHAQEKRNDDEASDALRDQLLPKCDEMFAKLFESFRCAFAAGDVFYLALGALFRPGSLLLSVDALNQQQLFMCIVGRYGTIHGTSPNEAQIRSDSEFKITTWALSWNPSACCINRKILEFGIPFFSGTRKIKGLPLYPFDIFADGEGQIRVKEVLIARGRRWAQLLSGKPSCWMHEGLHIPLVVDFESAHYRPESDERPRTSLVSPAKCYGLSNTLS
jgi:hypothetical protein